MTLTEIRAWLDENAIEYSTKYESESFEVPDPQTLAQKLFPSRAPKKTEYRKWVELTINSNNGKMNLELDFEQENGEYVFEGVFFGPHLFNTISENFEIREAAELIRSVMQGDRKVIIESAPDADEWEGKDTGYDLSVPTDGLKYNHRVGTIYDDNSHDLLRKGPRKYQIYDWETYDCVIKE